MQAVSSACRGADALSASQQDALAALLYGSDCFTFFDTLFPGNVTCSAAFGMLLSGAAHTAGTPWSSVYPCLGAGAGVCPASCQRELDVLSAACHATGASRVTRLRLAALPCR